MHTTPNMSAAINKVAYKVGELELNISNSNRLGGDLVGPVVDTLVAGEQKLQSSTLAPFNRKVQGMVAGKGFESEEDEIPQASFDLSTLASDEL